MLYLKLFARCFTCKTEINDFFIDEANHIYIAMPMYNLIEYSDNYWYTSRRSWQFKRDKVPTKSVDLSIDNSKSFKYKDKKKSKCFR